MVPKIDVKLIRWLVLLLNAVGLGFFCVTSWAFFFQESDELQFNRPDASKFAVEVSKKGSSDSKRADTVIKTLLAKKPKKVKPKEIVTKPPEATGPKPGGILAAWKIENVILTADCRMAFVSEGAESAVGEPSRSARASSSNRGRRGRTSPRGRRSRASARRGATGGTKIDSMIEGDGFRDFNVRIERITIDSVTYTDLGNNRQYTLNRDNYNPSDFAGGLRGQDRYEVDDPTATPQAEDLDQADRGAIKPGKAKTKSDAGTEAADVKKAADEAKKEAEQK